MLADWYIERRYWALHKLDRWALAASYYLPRRVALWAFVRVANEGCRGAPFGQNIMEIMERWDSRDG